MTPVDRMPRLLLASGSPRRSELLALTGWTASVHPAAVDETPAPGEAAPALARRLALAKAGAAAQQTADRVVLAADTIVDVGGRILGKPADADEASRMLRQLKGKDHRVFTALAVIDPSVGRGQTELCETSVPMRLYDDAEIEAYVASGAALDKAGAYGIQDDGFNPVAVERLCGCYANVMGMPLCHLARMMRRLGWPAPADVPAACQAHTGYDCPVYSDILGERA